MARLRIRIELNRGGVGVPLNKLASVVDESQKFFHLLTEDIQIDQSQGEWLGFDFGNESLNFTAEFVGPVTAEQVAAFNAAFDGTTSLRRATISQFARITNAIEQDELIGFGLYQGDDGGEPAEWRCLSRRDALRITEEIQLLIAATDEAQLESHLPAVASTGAGVRVFSDRRERGLEAAKWAAYVREVEANVDRRITRVEHALEGQSGMIEDLHVKSTSTEDSVRKLLTAVEGFCAQTTRQLEAIAAPAVTAVASVALPGAAVAGATSAEAAVESAAAVAEAASPVAESPVMESPLVASPLMESAAATEPAVVEAPIAEKIQEPESAPTKPLTQQPLADSKIEPKMDPPIESQLQPWIAPGQRARRIPASQLTTVELGWTQRLDWRLAGGAALLVAGAVIIVAWAWQNVFSGPSVQRVAATSSPVTSLPSPADQTKPTEPLPQTQPSTTASKSPAAPATATAKPPASPAAAIQHVTLQASELTWVSARDAAGTQTLARVFEKGDTRSLDLPNGSIVRIGNAGGLNIVFNGTPIGAVGKHGQVREVTFRNGSYKVVVADTP